MEKEDPIEKLERQQAEKKSNGGLKAVMIAMIVVALGLAAALWYVMSSENKLVGELNEEKQDLTEQIQALQSDYENLSSEYDYINAQLDSSREEIAQLVDRVKKTEATDRSKIRQYEKELGTLRSIMRGYITQIDSLNTLNHRLAEEAATARKEAEQTKQANTKLTQQVEALTSRVTAGSILKAHNFVMYAYNNNDKITDKANRVARFLVNLTLVENELAERGPVRVYVRVTDPDGVLLSDGRGTTFTFNGETLDATASREVDYQGYEVDLGIYVNNVGAFKKGVYTVDAYTTQAVLGHGELLLR
jgi:DNA repair ATPase RecN